MKDKTKLFLMIEGFLALYFLPLERLWQWRWITPAFFIARGSVMRYLGTEANKFLAYGVVSVSGVVLAVCYCGGIYLRDNLPDIASLRLLRKSELLPLTPTLSPKGRGGGQLCV